MENLLAEMKVLQNRRPARSDLERVLVVGYRASLRSGQNRHIVLRDLVQLTALTAAQLLIVDGGQSGRSRFAV